MLSQKPKLARQRLKDLLAQTADRIGPDRDPVTGESQSSGFGRVNAARIVEEVFKLP